MMSRMYVLLCITQLQEIMIILHIAREDCICA